MVTKKKGGFAIIVRKKNEITIRCKEIHFSLTGTLYRDGTPRQEGLNIIVVVKVKCI